MHDNLLLNSLKEKRVALGYANSIPYPGAIELCCPGWDFVWMCSQHGFYDYDTIYQGIITAERHGVAPVVRVPGHDAAYLGRMMDLAPAAIMVPFVNNGEEAWAIARATQFPPDGDRSYCGIRALALYGGAGALEKHTLVIAQIETQEGVKNAREIIETPGIDMLFFSADDLRLNLGISLDVPVDGHPLLMEYMRNVAGVCRDTGKLAGTVAVTDSLLHEVVQAGYTSIVLASDGGFLMQGRTYVQEKRKLL